MAYFLVEVGKNPPDWGDNWPREAIQFAAFTFAVFAFGFGALYPVASSKRKGARIWELHLVSIALGASSGVFTIPCLFLLFAWFRSDVKDYYHSDDAPGLPREY